MPTRPFDDSLARVPTGVYFNIHPDPPAPRARPPSPRLPPGFDERLARASLASINAGPDGLKSLRACQCNMTIYEVTGNKRTPMDPKSTRPNNNDTRSLLLMLPRELREHIYAYAVSYPEPIPIRLRSTTTRTGTTIIREVSFFTPPLLNTCQQIEADATPLFYATNTFRADLTNGDVPLLLRWLRETPASSLCHVRDLQTALAPTTVFDIQDLRSRSSGEGTRELASAIVETGMDLGGVVLVAPTLEHLARDVDMIGYSGAVDVEELRREWGDDFQEWLGWEDAQREAEELARRFEGLIGSPDRPLGD